MIYLKQLIAIQWLHETLLQYCYLGLDLHLICGFFSFSSKYQPFAHFNLNFGVLITVVFFQP